MSGIAGVSGLNPLPSHPAVVRLPVVVAAAAAAVFAAPPGVISCWCSALVVV